jgi:hypothetical protein
MPTVALQIGMKEHDPAPADDDQRFHSLLEASTSASVSAELKERFVNDNLRRIFRQI